MARAIGDDLRDLSADLRLPLLDDLGVGPALEWLGGRVDAWLPSMCASNTRPPAGRRPMSNWRPSGSRRRRSPTPSVMAHHRS